MIRKRLLSRSTVDPPILPDRVELDRDPRPAGPRSRAARRSVGTRPEVVEDHRPDVEDERLRRVERLLDHRHEEAQLAAGAVRVAAEQPFHDLGLEDDVRQALGRPVVHRPGDLAAEILLGVEDDPRHRRAAARRRQPRGRPPRHRRAAPTDPAPSTGSGRRTSRPRARQAVAEPGERLALALEDVDLGLHHRRPPGERHELGVERDQVVRRQVDARASFSVVWIRRCSCRVASVWAWATSISISVSSPSSAAISIAETIGQIAVAAG